jgi:hypothetical protein
LQQEHEKWENTWEQQNPVHEVEQSRRLEKPLVEKVTFRSRPSHPIQDRPTRLTWYDNFSFEYWVKERFTPEFKRRW